MGNSNGTLAEYWDAIETTPGLQGGFIWEWWDHGLVQTLPDGRTRWAYGGDFGDQPNDGNFCADGLTWPDGTPKPALREVQYLFAPARLTAAARDGHVRVANRQSFRDLGWLRGRWELVDAAGAVAASGRLATLAGIGPEGEAEVALEGWESLPSLSDVAGERWLTVRFETAADEAWAPAGTEVGWGQLALAADVAPAAAAPAADGGAPIELDADGHLRHPLLAAGPGLSLWRAPTDNDRFGGIASRWEAAGLADLRPGPAQVEHEGARVVVRREVAVGPHHVAHRQAFTPLPGGGIHVAEEALIPPGLDDLPRVGTVLELVPGLEQAEWFGLGPHESYPDRKRSGLVGRWQSTVGDLFTPYVRPQEAGGRADVRWLELRDEGGRGRPTDHGLRPCRSRPPTTEPPTWPPPPTPRSSSCARRSSSTSTLPTAGWARPPAGLTRPSPTCWGPAPTAGSGRCRWSETVGALTASCAARSRPHARVDAERLAAVATAGAPAGRGWIHRPHDAIGYMTTEADAAGPPSRPPSCTCDPAGAAVFMPDWVLETPTSPRTEHGGRDRARGACATSSGTAHSSRAATSCDDRLRHRHARR